MHQCRGLQGLARGLLRHLRRRQFPKFVIDERKQFLSGFRIALPRTVEDAGDIAHTSEDKALNPRINVSSRVRLRSWNSFQFFRWGERPREPARQ
jgi:hypothetical protein